MASNENMYIVREREDENEAIFHSDVMIENRIVEKKHTQISAENLSQQSNHFSRLFNFSNLPFQLECEQTKVFHLNSKWIWTHRWVIICYKSLANSKQTEKTWKNKNANKSLFCKISLMYTYIHNHFFYSKINSGFSILKYRN